MVATVSKISNAAQAATYYYQADPYFKENGRFYGLTAERLGLTNLPMDHSIFKMLVSGKIPTKLLSPEQQNGNADNRIARNFYIHSQQPHPGAAITDPANGLRKLSECGLATVGKSERAGVLSIDAQPDRSALEGVRRPDSEQLAQLKAEKFEEFIRVHRGGKNQRPGTDITFSAPKGLSILALAKGHEDLIEFHREAIKETMAALEKQAGCRITQDKQTSEIITGNYLIAGFDHSTTRPVTVAQLEKLGGTHAETAARLRAEGRDSIVGMNVHSHQFVMNLTWCEESQSFKAIDNNPIFKDQMLAGAMYHAALASKCRAAGYQLRDFGANGEFEFAAVDEKLIKALSVRGAMIEQELEKSGKVRATSTAREKDAINLATRNAKDHGADGTNPVPGWQSDLAEAERATGCTIDKAMAAAAIEHREEQGGPRTGREGVDSALRHLMEKSSIVKEGDVIRWAIANARGYYTPAAVETALVEMKASGEILGGEMKRQDGPGAAKAAAAFKESEATAGMIKYARSVAKQKGIEAPASKRFEDFRAFLDEHAPAKLGLKNLEEQEGSAANRRAGEIVLTTRDAQSRERNMLASVKAGQGTMTAIMSREAAGKTLAARNAAMQKDVFDKAKAKGKTTTEAAAAANKAGMNPGQCEAAELILTSTDRVNVILGVAGAGKSFTLGQSKEIIEQQATTMGLQIHGVAPSHQAKNELKEVTGAGDTLQAFLTNPKEWQKFGKRHLLIVDEAGMASTKQMAELERISAKQGFRYFLVGDLRQTAAVDAGKPLEQISKIARKAEMNDSVRHKTAHLAESAKLAAEGRMAESLERLGSVKEIKSDGERRKYIADRFISIGQQAETEARAAGKPEIQVKVAGELARKETLLLTTTNDARKEINQHVRESLGLAGAGREIDSLSQKNTSAEERKFLKTYRAGEVLQFSSEYKSLDVKSGDRLTIAELKSDRMILTDRAGNIREFRPANFNPDNWGIYRPERIELAPGDRVRLRENQKDFQNGDWGKVVSIDEKAVQIQSERDPKKIWHIKHAERALCVDHGYAMTAHGAQGATKDRTLVDMDTRSPTLNKETAYVMDTRSRFEVEIVSNDLKKLPDVISQAGHKPNALDLDQYAKTDLKQEHATAPETAMLSEPEHGQGFGI